MRFRNSGALALLLMAGCASDAAGPAGAAGAALRGNSRTLLSGRVLGFTAAPDSSLVALRGAEIVVYRVDSIPVDTIPVDTLPVDSMLYGGLALRPFVLDSGMRDSIPVDTVPPDTNPPPPPPPPGCGRTGVVVARVLTRGDGRFRIAGLPPAKYDLQISPPPGSPFAGSFYCGVHLLERHPVELRLYLPPVIGAD